MSIDDEDIDHDDGSDWTPPPPPDDEDEYEDPNPRAAGPDEPRKLYERPVSARQAREAQGATHLSEAIALLGMGGALSGLLDVAAQDKPADAKKVCPVCNKEATILFSALRGGTISKDAECGRCQGDRNRRKVEQAAALVRELKQIAEAGDSRPEREREIIAQLREYDHPDVDGLLRWCKTAHDRASRPTAATKKTRGGW